ncbi:MAG: sugar phosphate isomerase/epimerase [Deltaproteobacteria bacterium]|nr:sugar phosphate isomerase/epimerase [Deltaproteobacteria bacterium]
MAITAAALKSQVQVNIPFPYLERGYLEKFLELGLNPEIGLDAYSLDHYPPAAFRRAARAFQAAGRRITLHAPFQDLLPGALDDAILAASRRRLRQAFRYLPVFRPASVVCHLGYAARFYGGDTPKWLDRAVATWKELAARAAACGVTVMLENVYETGPELHLEIVRRVDAPNLKVCLDVGHLFAFGGGDLSRWLETLAPVIGQLHLHDNHGAADEHLALGAGTIPWQEILQFFAERRRQPLITLEPHQEDSLQPSLDFLAQIWPW